MTKLIEDFYDILSRREEGGESVCEVTLNPACKVYEGHFPGTPVSPGVCNIQMILECASEVAGKPLMLTYIAQCRMTRLITPNEFHTLEVRISLDGENLRASIGAESVPAQEGIEAGTERETYLTLKGTVA
jgi:3-hydroxyacyl-[acyl-carrier-protein] dehydratase